MKKRMALLFSVVLLIGLIPVLPMTVKAEGTAEIRNVNLDTSYLAPSDGTWDKTNDHKVFFGQYGGTSTAFRVLKAEGTSMMLDCDTIILLTKAFDADCGVNTDEQTSGNMNEWKGSDLEKWLNDTDYYGNTSVFTSGEQSVIQQTSLLASEADYDINGWGYKDYAANDYVYLLSAKEANDLYADNAARVKTGGNAYWWLRSADADYDRGAGVVTSVGRIYNSIVNLADPGVSPALNLNPASVIFASAANQNKASAFKMTDEAMDNKTWNLTLAGGIGFSASLDNAVIEPEGITEGNYTLKVFAEDVRSYETNNATDYASNMVSFDISVHSHVYETDWTSDETGHWHECSCGDKKDVAGHIFKWVIDKEATKTEAGSKHEECSECGYKKASVEIPKIEEPTKEEKPVVPGKEFTGKEPIEEELMEPVKAGKNYNKISWNKVKGADGYYIFAAPCNNEEKKNNLELVQDITSGKTTSFKHEGLKKATWYKYRVVAYKIVDGKRDNCTILCISFRNKWWKVCESKQCKGE